MNAGKKLLAQLIEFVPWTSFRSIVERYSGDARASTLPCTEHFRIMAARVRQFKALNCPASQWNQGLSSDFCQTM